MKSAHESACACMARQSGFSLLELLCSLVIMAALVGMLLPAIQQSRESARSSACQNNLRQLAIAAHGWEASHGRLPPGTLGYPSACNLRYGELLAYADDPVHEFYFFGQQHTSWLLQVLPWVEQQALADTVPDICRNFSRDYRSWHLQTPGSPRWLDGFPEVRSASATPVALFLCPGDSPTEVDLHGEHPAGIGAQPLFLTDTEHDLLFQRPVELFDQLSPAPTSYAGVTGAYSGGELPDVDDELVRAMRPFRGVFRSRRSCGFQDIADGASNTLLVGETIGFIRNRVRSGRNSWFFGGLARGRSAMIWEKDWSVELPGLRMFGDAWYAWPVGFGSMHPSVCNFARADGSVGGIARGISWQSYNALTGVADGSSTPGPDQ